MIKTHTHKRKVLFVEVDQHLEHVSDSGLIIPRGAGVLNDNGIVFLSEEGSSFAKGDNITFKKISSLEETIDYDVAEIEGKIYHVIYEDMVWSLNDRPKSAVFITPVSQMSVADSDLVIPEDMKGIPQKGIVQDAPNESFLKKGDVVQYRKREGEVYAQAIVDGSELDILNERNVFTVNGKVAPSRMVIRIDKELQKISRTTAENGLALSPLFIKMLHNLQYGKCYEIGDKAKEMYPDVNVGDTLILHHSFEEDEYRILSKKKGPLGNIKSEFRIANCFDVNYREIFGKMECNGDELDHSTLVPFGNYVFLKWDIELFNKKPIGNSDFITNFDFDIQNCTNIDSLLTTCSSLKEKAADAYGLEYNALVTEFKTKNPEDEQQYHEAQVIGNKIEAMKLEAQRLGNELQKNHIVIASIAAGENYSEGQKVLIRYRGAYPITLQKEKYIIVSQKDILAIYQNENMTTTIKPTLDRILIEPIVVAQAESDLIIPDTLKELPRTGIVISIGDLAIDKPGFPCISDKVLFRRGRGVELKYDGKEYLLMGQDDVLCTLSETE